ncbi:uncharacterized protein DS421_7g213550 [Arachis hypogaea]|nr:uncharacterized protein DS421_7g213550 [Arachis hypogaea]
MLASREPLARGWFKETGSWWGAAPRQMVVENNPRGQSRAPLPRFKARRPAATWIVPSATSGQAGLPAELSISISGGKETNEDSLVTASEPGRAQHENRSPLASEL